MEFLTKANIDFIGKRNIAVLCSIILIIAGLVTIYMKGGIIKGIDFAGGTIVRIKFNKNIETNDISNALDNMDLGTFTIQHVENVTEPEKHDEVLIRLAAAEEIEIENTPSSKVIERLKEVFGEDQFEIRGTESVGPTIGKELQSSAYKSIIGALIMILIYITFRFEFKFALGAIAALIHDVFITVGIFTMLNKEFNLPIVAALLTIVGYSLNDTIVVFDRIRENMRLLHREKFATIINSSINQTLSRTILTSLTTLLVIIALFVFGGDVIHDFSFTLLIGIVVGTYSSIFIASPVLLWWRRLEKSTKARQSNKQGATS